MADHNESLMPNGARTYSNSTEALRICIVRFPKNACSIFSGAFLRILCPFPGVRKISPPSYPRSPLRGGIDDPTVKLKSVAAPWLHQRPNGQTQAYVDTSDKNNAPSWLTRNAIPDSTKVAGTLRP
jgi:hypothetical protein